MPLLLSRRAPQVTELMDDPGCDTRRLNNTYAGFSAVNRAISGWARIYARWIAPLAQGRACRLLDIGFGGGDVLRSLARWAKRDGLKLELTGIDTDPRALTFVNSRRQDEVRFLQASAGDLISAGELFDVVLSNHLLHHLPERELIALCRDSVALSRKLVIHNDIERGDLAFLAFALTGPFFLSSFITVDGLRSIRRSFTAPELSCLAPPGWRVKKLFPYRLLLVHQS
ncbi:MAG: methyltransferase domain-containing protein [Truepera sp.]|nr:methyltransferase domain-containing protein [Truepera sp.]MBS3967794.1 methyltransferase domain-containing protein [Truepera sp.]